MIYIRLKTFFCAQLMGIKYNLQSEVIHGKVSLSNWFRIYDWFHSNCFEFYDSGCILLVNTRTVLSPVGPGKMSVMVNLIRHLSSFLCIILAWYISCVVGRYRKKVPIIFQEWSQPMGEGEYGWLWTLVLSAFSEVEPWLNVRKVFTLLNLHII